MNILYGMFSRKEKVHVDDIDNRLCMLLESHLERVKGAFKGAPLEDQSMLISVTIVLVTLFLAIAFLNHRKNALQNDMSNAIHDSKMLHV